METVNLKDREPIEFNFIIGKEPREIVLDGRKVRALFENDSKTCPITSYELLKDEKGSRFGFTDPVFKYLQYDRQTSKLTIRNTPRRETTTDFYIRASTAGRKSAI